MLLLWSSSAGAAGPVLPTEFLDTGEGRLAYDDSGGTGPLVIAVPGMGDLRREYRHLTPLLIRAGYRVVSVDLRGFGETSAAWRDYSAHAVGGDLLRLEDRLGRRQAVLMGTSISAGATIWAAHDAPGRVAGLVLLAPVLRDPPSPPPWYARAMLALAFMGPWRVPLWLQYWQSLFVSRTPPDQASARRALARNLRQPGRMGALEAMMRVPKAATAEIVGQVRTPTLVVMGTKDPDLDDPAAEVAWIAGRTGASVQMVAGAGHYPHLEMPEQVAPRVLAFLAGADQRSSTPHARD